MARRSVGNVEVLPSGAKRVRVTSGTDDRGKPRTVRVTLPPEVTLEEAKIAAAAVKESLGIEPHLRDLTLRQYWEHVFPTRPSVRGVPRTPQTMLYYRKQMDRNVLPRLGDTRLSDLTHAMLKRCILESSAPTNTKRTLSAVLNAAFDDGYLKERPLQRRVPVAKRHREQVPAWSRFEAAQALRALSTGDPMLYAYAILGMSGLRESESLGVRPVDVRRESTYSFVTGEQVETMTVTVAQTYTDDGGLRAAAKNEHSLRTVPVLPSLRDDLEAVLAAFRREAVEAAETAGEAPEEAVRAWAARRIVAYDNNRLGKLWRRALRDAGVRHIPPDMLRHTTDTLALTAGVSPDLNDKMHGRSEHASTYRNYFRPDV